MPRAGWTGIIWRLVLLAVLNAGRPWLLRLYVPARHHVYELLGPGFTRGLPLLNLVLTVGLICRLSFLVVRSPIWRRAMLLGADLLALVGVGLLLAMPKLVLVPSCLDLPVELGDLLPKVMAVPVLMGLTGGVIRDVVGLWRESHQAHAGRSGDIAG